MYVVTLEQVGDQFGFLGYIGLGKVETKAKIAYDISIGLQRVKSRGHVE